MYTYPKAECKLKKIYYGNQCVEDGYEWIEQYGAVSGQYRIYAGFQTS